MQQAGLRSQLTDASMELHGDDRALVALVLPGAVPKLGHPALGRPVCRAAVHQPVHHQDADHRICVPVHRLVKGKCSPKQRQKILWTQNQNSVGKRQEQAVRKLYIGSVSRLPSTLSKATTAAILNFLFGLQQNDPK